jgi:hypothetical protein
MRVTAVVFVVDLNKLYFLILAKTEDKGNAEQYGTTLSKAKSTHRAFRTQHLLRDLIKAYQKETDSLL